MSSDEERVEAPLLQNEYSDEESEKIRNPKSYLNLRFLLLHLCFFVVNLLLLVILLRTPARTTTCEPPMIYCEMDSRSLDSIFILTTWAAPAREAVKPEKKTIHADFKHHSKFNGKPNPESDIAWNALFKSDCFRHFFPRVRTELQLTCALDANIRIHPDEIDQLGRTSVPISDDSGDFYGTLGR